MTAVPTLTGPALPPKSGPKAEQLVVFLHGVGADGNDLIGLAPYFAEALPKAAFISPNAPYAFDMAPFGYQWFSLLDRRPAALLEGVRAAAPALDAFLDAELAKWKLADNALALVGFSQGTMMALYVALRRPHPCAALVGFSGALIGAETLFQELKSRPPVLLIHGDQDPVVPFQALAHAETGLLANAVAVERHVCRGLGHGIAPEGLDLAVQFVAKAFAH